MGNTLGSNPLNQGYDAIVIGSGIGGLTVAAILSKLCRKRVLVLEQHFTPGGFTHTFKRKGKYEWDVGLHYVGDVGKGDIGRAVFDYLSNENLFWQKMPDPFEKFVYPDFTFEVYSNLKRYQSDLMLQYPHEQKAIKQYFRDAFKAALWYGMDSTVELFPGFMQPLLRRIFQLFGGIARQTTQHYLDRHFQDVHLKALLVSQWGDYGLPPSRSSFGIHGLIVSHYFHGAWFPVGGSKAIADTIIPVIKHRGGHVMTQRQVTEILIEDGTAIGVKVQKTGKGNSDYEEYYSPIIVSDAGAYNTYLKLIPSSVPLLERAKIQAFPKGTSMITAYLALKESPEIIGLRGENHWIYETYDHNSIPHDSPFSAKGFPNVGYLSFPSMKNKLAQGHTAEVITFCDYDVFKTWKDQPWRKRDSEYLELKSQIIQSIIKLVESHYPGFEDLIAYAELSTPLTVEHFDGSDRGAVYGIPCIPERFEQSWARVRTPIKNLYLTGADTFSMGIVGAMMGGVKTASILQGPFGFFRILAAILRGKMSKRKFRCV